MEENNSIYTKESLLAALIDIRNRGWIMNARPGNVGGVGNTLEDLLGIEENNLPIPNAAEWELKTQRANTSSLTTIRHIEPSPTALRFVPKILLPLYGWPHNEAGKKYPEGEMSFRQTINAVQRTDRGFGIIIDRNQRRVELSFDSKSVSPRHSEWLRSVEKRIGLGELDPQPYWGFDDLFHSIGTKLKNCFYIKADVKTENGIEYYHYKEIYILRSFRIERFLDGLEQDRVLVDFDARTGHNHGTKFRLRQNYLPILYDDVQMY